MGQETAAIVAACILQRAQHINTAGGYLRALTEKARAGNIGLGPIRRGAQTLFKRRGFVYAKIQP